MIRAGTIIRWAVRLLLLAVALLLLWGTPLHALLARIWPGETPPSAAVLDRALPAVSPLVAFMSSVAQKSWYLGLFWAAPPVLLLLLGFWKGRFFCRWICPAGTVYSIPERWSRKKKILKVHLNAYLFWIIVFASLVGAPLALFLDPLSTFSRIGPVLTGAYTIASLVPGLLVPLILVLVLIQPMIWCAYVCPLGYLFGLCHRIPRRGPRETFSRSRRQIVTGLFVGLPLGALARKLLFAKSSYKIAPILPPGAKDLETFASACVRCYACVDVCPTKVIRVGFHLDRAVGQLFQPEVEYFDSEEAPDCGYCPEPCNECSDVCPAGALSPLTFDQKWHRQIGVAKIIREACLAWEDGEDCVVCQEVCSYQAIESKKNEKGVPQPVVKEDVCRGCGACYSKCPAIREGKAIVISGVEQQKQLPDEDTKAPTSAPASDQAATRP